MDALGGGNRRIPTIANQTPDTTARVETALSAVDHDMMRDSTELRGPRL